MVSASFLNAVLRGERSQICPYMLSAKQGSIWYRFYNVFGMTRSGIEHTTSRSRGERSNHRATAATFGSMVKPILYYASQIWGYAYMYVYTIKSVHNRFCKIFIMYNVRRTTDTCIVLGECGRLPLCTIYYINCIRYWCKLLTMPSHSFPKQCYNVLKSLDDAGRN